MAEDPHREGALSPGNDSPASSDADLNMRILQSPIWFVIDNFGEDKLNSICFEAGLSAETLRHCRGWISLEQTEIVLKMVRELAGSDEAFMDSCAYRMKDSYGPLRFLLWASSPVQMLEMGQRHFSTISSFSRGDFSKITDSRFRLRYHSTRKESRLMCLSRQAQSKAMPGLWDMPAAGLRETACICRGDDFCEYELSVYEKSRFLPVLVGGLLGAVISALTVFLKIEPLLLSTYIWGITPVLGASVGYIMELRRANRHNLKVAEDINQGLSQIVVENQETQQEILNLHQRQKEWNRRLEQQAAERVQASEKLTVRLQSILEEQASALKGVSHDMKNPLTVVLQTSEIMKDQLTEENRWLADEQKKAVSRIRDLLDDLLHLETEGTGVIQFMPERVETAPLEESLRRRLRAMSGNKGLRISVISSREAPECILVDRMLLDRVVDNLLTNAVKYTDQGSIVLELDGKPGFLTIKISDTGRGIDENSIRNIFKAGGSNPDQRELNSHGIGLSVVIRLLDRIGGRLEVMSLPGRGSTFWVHFPVEPSSDLLQGGTTEEPAEDPASRIVTIRPVI